jgi:PhoU domain
MNTKQQIQVLRSQLFKMARLSQRAVDYSIKAYELGRPEFCQHVRNSEHELGELHRSLEDRCRRLLIEELPFDSDFRFVWSALRISSALRTTHAAAAEIARMTMVSLRNEGVPESDALEALGQVANGLVRLYTVALFKEEAQHARTVLHSQAIGQWTELAARHSRKDIRQEVGAEATFELAIAERLGQIVKQAYEIAHAVTVWLERRDRTAGNRNCDPYAVCESQPIPEKEAARQTLDSIGRGFCP